MGDHPVLAAVHGRLEGAAVRALRVQGRPLRLSTEPGRVLALGGWTEAGHDLAAAKEVVVVEPEGAVRRRMVTLLATVPVPVRVEGASIHQAGLAGESFDTVVSTFALCRVADPGAVLAELRRVLAPGGSLVFLEHVSGTGWRRRLQEAASPAWQRLTGGCHLDRDAPALIRAAGWAITEIRRCSVPSAALLVSRVALGSARPRTATAGIRPSLASPAASPA